MCECAVYHLLKAVCALAHKEVHNHKVLVFFCANLFSVYLFIFYLFINLLSIKYLCEYININDTPTNQEAGKVYTDINHAHLSHTTKSHVR